MGTPNYPRDMASEWNQVKRDVKNAFTSANLRTGMAKIGAKVIEVTGQLALNAGATLISRYANNNVSMLVGKHTSGDRDIQGFYFRRPDGTLAMWAWGDEDNEGFLSIYDKQGHTIFGDDGASGQGLARPYIPYNVVRTSDLITAPTVNTTTTFQGHVTVAGYSQHPKIHLRCYLYVTGNDVAQVRLYDPDTSTAMFTSGNIAATDNPFLDILVPHTEYGFGEYFKYDVEARRVSGTGAGVGVSVLITEGRQS